MKRLAIIVLLFFPSAFKSIAQDLDGDWKLYLEDELVRKSESLSVYADGDGCFQGGYSLKWNDADWNQIKKSDEDVSLDCLGNGLYKVNPSEGASFYVKFMGENGPDDYLLLCDEKGKALTVTIQGEPNEQRFIKEDEMFYGAYPPDPYDAYGEEGMYKGEGDYEGEIVYEEEGVVYAKPESEERYYDWGERPTGDGPDGWMLGIMDHPFTVISASKELGSQGKFTFGSDNVSDDDPTTAWVPDPNGIEDYPMGTKIVVEGPVYNEAIDILNGYQYSNDIFDANSRIKRLALYVNDTYWFEVELSDVMGPQKITLPEINLNMGDGGGSVTIMLEVLELYPGSKYPEYGISGIYTRGG